MPGMASGASASTRNCSSNSNTMRSTGSSGAQAFVQRRVRCGEPQREPVGGAAEGREVVACRARDAGAARTSGSGWRPRCRRRPRKCRSALAAEGADEAAHSSSTCSLPARAALAHALTRLAARRLQLAVEAALEVLGHQRPLGLVALVDEGQAERERRVAEDLEVLGPGDDGARRHQRRQVARGEALAREIGHRDHGPHHRAACVVRRARARAPGRSRSLRRPAGS